MGSIRSWYMLWRFVSIYLNCFRYMADNFLDEEADVGTSSEDEKSLKSGSDDDEDRRPKKKKEKKRKRVAVESDDDEEEGKCLSYLMCCFQTITIGSLKNCDFGSFLSFVIFCFSALY